MKVILTGIVMFIGFLVYAQVPNNPIFNGGQADGFRSILFAQPGNNIFNGGEGDGFNHTTFAQTVQNIFNGGEGDGFNYTVYTQPFSNIFNGGEADGWSFANFSQSLNDIFKGGDSDGWNSTNFSQAGNNIFTGGEGDGWASTYRALGPLPVTILSFEASKAGKEVLLTWEAVSASNFQQFEVEKSMNSFQFSKIGTVPYTSTTSYMLKDKFPAKGNNYYRLKLMNFDGSFTYTPVRVVNFEQAETKLNIYPNPVNDHFNILLNNTFSGQNLLVNVINTNGQLVLQQRVTNSTAPLIKVSCSRLLAGTYIVHLISRDHSFSATFIKL